EPGDDVLAADRGPQPAADLGHQGRDDLATDVLAGLRQAVELDQQQGRGAGGGAVDPGSEGAGEAGPVGQAGHRVGVGDALQRLLAGVALGHVPAVQDDRADVGVAPEVGDADLEVPPVTGGARQPDQQQPGVLGG